MGVRLFEPLPAWRRLSGMEKIVHDMLKPLVRSFIEDRVFAIFQKLGNWFEARISSVAARVVIGVLLSVTAVVLIVTITALAGF